MERFVKMICKNCNGEYEANAVRCPFCGSENEAEVEKRKEQLLQHYDDEAKRIAAEVPKKAVKKGTKLLLYGIGIGLGAAVVIIAVSLFIHWVNVNAGYRAEQKHLSKLEEYFRAGQYDKMSEYQKKHRIYGITYEKYYEVSGVISKWERVEEQLSDSERFRESNPELAKTCRSEAVENAANLVRQCNELIGDTAFRGNEEVLRKLLTDGMQMLESYGITMEELKE